jgi:hypothetical protein
VPGSLQTLRKRNVWQICVPLLLIGFLLYNPFLALVSHSDGLAYQQLARHRATVGASELQHFASMEKQSLQPEVAVVEIVAVPVFESVEFSSHLFEEVSLPPRPEQIQRIWFRPPPTA